MDSVICGKCGSEAIGRMSPAFLEKTGWRMVDGAWHCPCCTGLFWTQIKDNPEAMDWIEEKRREHEEGGAHA